MSTHLAISTNPKNPTQLPIDKGGSTIVNLSTKTVYLGTWYFLPTKTSTLGRGSLPVEAGPIYAYANTGTVILSVVPGLATPSIPNPPATSKSTAWMTGSAPPKITSNSTAATQQLYGKLTNNLRWHVWPQTLNTPRHNTTSYLVLPPFGTNFIYRGALAAVPYSSPIPSGRWAVSLNVHGTVNNTITIEQEVVRIGFKKANNTFVLLGSLIQTVKYGPAKSSNIILTLLFSGTLTGSNTTTTKQIYLDFWLLGKESGAVGSPGVTAEWGGILNPISLPFTM